MTDRNISSLNISQLIQFWSETNIKIYNTTVGFFIDPKNKKKTIYDAIQELISSGEKVLAIPLLDKEKVLDVGTVESYMASQITSFRYV